MESIFSATSSPSPSDSPDPNPKTTADSTSAMSSTPSDKPASSEPDPTVETPKTLETEIPNEESTEASPVNEEEGANRETEEEEGEGECGFCLFMKGGECRETFISWEKCVEEGEKNDEDIVNKCFEATSALKKCMEAHPDYYGVILQAEKDAEQEVSNQLDREKEHVAENSSDSDSGEQQQQQKQEVR